MSADLADRLAALRERAEAVIARLSTNPPARPLFVEFSGSPKSGKSTCIETVAHFFRRLKFKVLAPSEGASKRTPYYLKDDIVAFNTWSASYALGHILEGLYHSDRYHLAILDRGLFDALVWFELMAVQGNISRETCTTVHNFLLVEKWRAATDAVFLFKADAATSMERENKDKLIAEPGRAMNPEFLKPLNEAYDRVKAQYAAQFPKVEVIDTGRDAGTTPQSTAAGVTATILELLERQTRA
jgi:thymidylate kinase